MQFLARTARPLVPCEMLGRVTYEHSDRATNNGVELRLSEVLSSLSYALDMTEGQARGHSERSCLIGMRLAAALDLDDATRSSLFYALLLKDAGCSSNAARVAALFGADDAAVKSSRRLTDTASARRPCCTCCARRARASRCRSEVGTSPPYSAPDVPARASIVELRCERGAEIARAIGLGEVAARAIRDLDEHWDGGGYPAGRSGDGISLAGRVLCLAQTAEVYWRLGGSARGVRDRARGGRAPGLIRRSSMRSSEPSRMANSGGRSRRRTVTPLEPPDHVLVADDARLDRVVHAFASIIDAKSPYTSHHSEGVAEDRDRPGRVARRRHRNARRRCSGRRCSTTSGSSGSRTGSWTSRVRLASGEWETVRRHPRWSMDILARVSAFHDVARIAAAHHERLDGSGYYQGLTAAQLDRPSRILAVADVAEALTAQRPYRRGAQCRRGARRDASRRRHPAGRRRGGGARTRASRVALLCPSGFRSDCLSWQLRGTTSASWKP